MREGRKVDESSDVIEFHRFIGGSDVTSTGHCRLYLTQSAQTHAATHDTRWVNHIQIYGGQQCPGVPPWNHLQPYVKLLHSL